MAAFAFTTDIDSSEARFDAESYRHEIRVMRHKPGDEISFLDGGGRIYAGRIIAVDHRRKTFSAAITACRGVPPPTPRIILATAIPRGKVFDHILQKATELGVAGITPLITARTVARPGDGGNGRDGRNGGGGSGSSNDSGGNGDINHLVDRKRHHWLTVVREAAKQCGNPYLPVIDTPVAVADWSPESNQFGLLLDPTAISGFTAALPLLTAKPATVTLACGPEGGFTADETELLRARGFIPVALGPLTLRLETAVTAALAITLHLSGRFDGKSR
jgi:16S rRNA (uracil1498-N3)-methyltransferase